MQSVLSFIKMHTNLLKNQDNRQIYELKTANPTVTLDNYIQRMQKYIGNIDIYASVIINILNNWQYTIKENMQHKLLAVIIMYINKLYDDRYNNNIWYSKIFGISLEELNKMELQFLEDMQLIKKIEL